MAAGCEICTAKGLLFSFRKQLPVFRTLDPQISTLPNILQLYTIHNKKSTTQRRYVLIRVLTLLVFPCIINLGIIQRFMIIFPISEVP